MKKILITLLALVLMAAPINVYAQATKSATLTAAVKAKSLSLTAPASAVMNAIDISETETETTGTLTGVQVADLRGKKTPLGWSLSMTVTDFKTADNDVIKVSQLKVVPGAYKFISGKKDGGVTVPALVNVTDANNDGTSDALSLMTASAGNGAGSFSIDPVLKLLVPAYSIAGDYTSTITLTLI